MLGVQRDDAKQRATDFQDLALRFEELQIKVTGKEHEMEQAMIRNKIEHKEVIERLGNELSDIEERYKDLAKKNTNSENELKQKNEEIEQAREEINRIRAECSFCQSQVEDTSNALKEVEMLLKNEKKEQERAMQEYQQLEGQYKAEILALKNSCSEKDNELRLQTSNLLGKEEELKESNSTVSSLNEALLRKNLEIEDLLGQLKEASEKNSEMKYEVSSLAEKLQNLQQILNDVESSLKITKEEEEKMRISLENEKTRNLQLKEEAEILQNELNKAKELESEVNKMKEKIEELEGNKEELEFQANFAMSQVEEITSQFQVITSKNQTLEDEAAKIKKDSCQVEIKHEEALKELRAKETKVAEMISELNKSREEFSLLQAKYEKMCLEKCNNEGTLQELMMSRDKSVNMAENKVKSLQERVSAKVKQISKLQSEIKSLKSQLKSQEKLTQKMESDLSAANENCKALEQSNTEITDAIKQKEKSIEESYEQLRVTSDKKEKEREHLEKKMDELKKTAEISNEQCLFAQKELASAKQAYEADISEMCRTLETYKMENEKLMNVKEKELDQKTKDILESKDKLESLVRERDQELQMFQKQIAEKNEKIEELIQKLISANKVPREEKQPKAPFDMDVEMVSVKAKGREEIESSRKSPNGTMDQAHTQRTESPHVRKLFPKSPLATPSTTPRASLQTPQSILRYGDDRPGKSKRVAFNFNDDESSDEEDPLNKRQRVPNTSATSKLPSKIISVKPTVRESPKLVVPPTPKGTRTEKVYNRGHSDKKSPGLDKAKKVRNSEEIDQFNKLFPKQTGVEEKGRKSEEKSKKPAFKSKIKKVVPRTKKSSTEKMDLSWFDADSAFGFGSEE
ncbi:myosin-9-like [Rhopilema esculentum]|uniref:myosin-9-like n=1 Tax=Rhopilema esculentum TaxID=499914 RepID=UPI0031E43D9B